MPLPTPEPVLPAEVEVFAPPSRGSGSGVQIAEHAKTVAPGEALPMALSSPAGQTRFEVFSQTTPTNARLVELTPMAHDGFGAAIRLPADLPQSTYFIWPKVNGVSGKPVVVNRTEAWWVGPDRAAAGEVTAVHGRNLSHGKDGTSRSFVYIKPVGVAQGQYASVVSVNPYRVEFKIPDGLSQGAYEVWTHNGHGGRYGWSKPANLIIQPKFTWDGPLLNVRNYGAKGDGATDDTAAIVAATNAARAAGARSTVYFPAGTYIATATINPTHVRLKGDGMNASTIKAREKVGGGPLSSFRLIFNGFGGNHFGFEDLTLSSGSTLETPCRGEMVRISDGAHNIHFLRTRLEAMGCTAGFFNNSHHLTITDSELIGGSDWEAIVFFGNSYQNIIKGVVAKGTYDAGIMLSWWAGHEISVTRSEGRDYDRRYLNGWAKGRFLYGGSNWGSNFNKYWSHNNTYDLDVRRGSFVDINGRSDTDVDPNSGEQLLWEGTLQTVKQTPSGFGAQSIRYASAVADVRNQMAMVVAGTGFGQTRRIAGIDTSKTSLTLEEPWAVVPDATSQVLILTVPHRVVAYDNRLRGKLDSPTRGSAAAGINSFEGGTDMIVDRNTMENLRQGSFMWSLEHGGPAFPQFFLTITNNTITNVENAINTPNTRLNATMEHFGHVIRANTITNAIRHGISLGSDGGAYYTNCTRQHMTVIERNSVSNARMGAILELRPLEANNGAKVDGIPETCENTLVLDNVVR